MKWQVLKDKDGNPLEAGYCVLSAGEGQSVDEYDEADKTVIALIKKRPKAVSKECKVMCLIAADKITDKDLQAVVRYLQSQFK